MPENKRGRLRQKRVVEKPHLAAIGKQVGYVPVGLCGQVRYGLKRPLGPLAHKRRQLHVPVRLLVQKSDGKNLVAPLRPLKK